MNAIKTEWPQSFVEATGLDVDDENTVLNALYESVHNKRYLNVVELYYKEKESYDQIAKKYSVTRERIRQIIRRVINETINTYKRLKLEEQLRKQIEGLDARDIPILYTTLSIRTKNTLVRYLLSKAKRIDPKTSLTYESFKIRDILELSIEEFDEIRNFGIKAFEETLRCIYDLGIEPLVPGFRWMKEAQND